MEINVVFSAKLHIKLEINWQEGPTLEHNNSASMYKKSNIDAADAK